MDRMPPLTSPCHPADPPSNEALLEYENGQLVVGTSDEEDAISLDNTATKDESTAWNKSTASKKADG